MPQLQQDPNPIVNNTCHRHDDSSLKLQTYLLTNKLHVDAALNTCLHSSRYTTTIVSAMRYSLLAGGKRIRPSLAIATYEMFAGPPIGTEKEKEEHLAVVMPTALAIEMIHTMSLIHDDLPCMDNDDVRRGKPTNHKIYGEDIAILAGDALLAYAFELVARETPSGNAQKVVDVVRLLAESVGPNGLAGGQAKDLKSEGDENTSLDTLKWIHTHKTAVLLRLSCVCGAVLGGARKEDVKRIGEFATKIGLAFQIMDDVLDVTQDTDVLGKTAGKDESSQKATYPKLLGLAQSKSEARHLIRDAKDILTSYGARASILRTLADFIVNRHN